MSENCGVIVIFPIYGQFGTIRKPEAGRIVCKTYIFINSSNLLSNKIWKQNLKFLTKLSHYCFELRYYFCKKALIIWKKLLTSAKLREPWYQKVYFLKLNKRVY